LRGAPDDGTIAGALHIHTNRSDGRSSPDEVAAAAARAGLRFVVFTDHGDGTRVPDPPVYRSGVLCLDGVEISTTGGHYIAVGMPAAPYPLGGEPRDVVEDVRRLGGFGIAAHPDSPKAELRWSDWDAPIDGLELLNPDTGWRQQAVEPGVAPKLKFLTAVGAYPFVPEETIASLLGDPSAIVERWQSLTAVRPVVALAGVEAHAKLALWDVAAGDNRFTLPFPGYEANFRTLSIHVRPERPLSGNAPEDGALVLSAIRSGHLYVAVDAVATPPSFEFTATSKDRTVYQGGLLPAADAVRLHIRSNAPPGFVASVWNGSRLFAGDRTESDFSLLAPSGPAMYRVEIRAANRPGHPIWIISNPIYVGVPAAVHAEGMAAHPSSPLTPAGPNAKGESRAVEETLVFPADAFGWTVEHDPRSRAAVELQGSDLRFSFGLDADASARPRVALTAPPLTVPPNERVTLKLRGDRPMRLSVQLRTGVDGPPEERWQRSIYVDTVERDVTVAFDDMRPVGITRSVRPATGNRPSLLLVVDTTNSQPGSSGELRISRVALAR
jgi:hypothetical protein